MGLVEVGRKVGSRAALPVNPHSSLGRSRLRVTLWVAVVAGGEMVSLRGLLVGCAHLLLER